MEELPEKKKRAKKRGMYTNQILRVIFTVSVVFNLQSPARSTGITSGVRHHEAEH